MTSSEKKNDYPPADFIRKAAAVRAARYVLGVSQVEMARIVNIPKTSLARFETLVSPVEDEVYDVIVGFLEESGVMVSIEDGHVVIHLTGKSLDRMAGRLLAGKRRQPVRGQVPRGPG